VTTTQSITHTLNVPGATLTYDALVPVFLRRAASDTTNLWIYEYQIDWNTPAGKEME
jgi:hypothetical protein